MEIIDRLSHHKTIINLHKISKQSTTEINKEEVISIFVSQDIYSALVLLIERDELKKLDKLERTYLYALASISAIIQIGSLILLSVQGFATEWYAIHSDLVEINDEEITIKQFTGLGEELADRSLTIPEYFWRLFAFFVLLSYTVPFIKSFLDYTVLIKHVQNCKYFMIMIGLEFIVYVWAMSIAGVIILNTADIIDIFDVGVGLIILLEVDDYLYKAVESSSQYINNELFVYELNEEEVRNTIYEKRKPLASHMIMGVVCYTSLIINQFFQMLLWDRFETDLGTKACTAISQAAAAICFLPTFCSAIYCLLKSFRARNY